jgi:hypothetical protein
MEFIMITKMPRTKIAQASAVGVVEQDHLDYFDLVLNVPAQAALALPSLRIAIQRAVDLALSGFAVDQKVIFDADKMAQLVVQSANPTVELVEERAGRLQTIKKILDNTKFLTGDAINALQNVPKANKHSVASDWKRRGRIFSVTGNDGKEYYPNYQFDMNGQPLPVIKDVLTALGEMNDTWAIASWFHFPNGWIAKLDDGKAVPAAPRDVLLTRKDDVIKAAKRAWGTHFA